MQVITVNVDGMKCGGCEARVKNALSTVDGVLSVEASFLNKKVIVQANDDVAYDEIKDVIEDLGFSVIK